jgi:hypothetical protein
MISSQVKMEMETVTKPFCMSDPVLEIAADNEYTAISCFTHEAIVNGTHPLDAFLTPCE